MLTDKKAVFQVASVYIGTVVGAGFASGQEIVQFFTMYGKQGIYGLLFTGFAFSLIGWAVLELVYEYQIKDYQALIQPIMGRALAGIIEGMVTFFLFVSFCAMLAGSGALLHQRFQIPSYVGILVMGFACFFTFLYDVEGIVFVNVILAPILFLGGILLAVYILIFRDVTVFTWGGEIFKSIRYHWFSSSILYVSYNSLTAIVVLTTLLPYLKNKKVARKGGILGGVALGGLGLCLGLVNLCYRGRIEYVEIPLLEIVMCYAPIIQWIYFFILFSAMFTTAVSSGYGFANRISTLFSLPTFLAIILTIMGGGMIARLGFSNIVRKIYPLFGYGGILEVSMILLFFIRWKIRKY
ncbi:MAG: hypothetical protein GX238_11345 [Epulopiscium sp.]|nr:hypothetical protein [Candidatus Epulonipiscium sp.]